LDCIVYSEYLFYKHFLNPFQFKNYLTKKKKKKKKKIKKKKKKKKKKKILSKQKNFHLKQNHPNKTNYLIHIIIHYYIIKNERIKEQSNAFCTN